MLAAHGIASKRDFITFGLEPQPGFVLVMKLRSFAGLYSSNLN